MGPRMQTGHSASMPERRRRAHVHGKNRNIMTITEGAKRFTMAHALFRTALAGAVCAGALYGGGARVALADSNDWIQEEALRGEGRSRAEVRAERRLIRDALRAKLEPEFRSDIPVVSDATLAGLNTSIARYRAIVQAGGWPAVPIGTLRINDSGPGVTALRQRLWLTGDLRTKPRRRRGFDSDLEEAVARYQIRNGLRVSGFVDIRTRRALNVPAHERLRQLETNHARITELMKVNKASRYVLVNVPAFELQAVDTGQLELRSNVVVGKPARETPSVSAKIRELNFFPYWRVPDSIARKDLVPAIRKDPSYFFKERFSLLPTWGAEPFDPAQIDWMSPDIRKYKFRQDPGPHNALGVVRINMPNKHIVYLHDTPLKQLFGQSSRAFSSGCVRVERVLDLAGWLLKETPEWDPMRVQVTVAQGDKQDVKLKKAVPVHFVYVTAWASERGIPFFRPDIYGRDGTAVEMAENIQESIPGSGAISP